MEKIFNYMKERSQSKAGHLWQQDANDNPVKLPIQGPLNCKYRNEDLVQKVQNNLENRGK